MDSKLSFHMWKFLIWLYNYTNRKLHFVTCFYATKKCCLQLFWKLNDTFNCIKQVVKWGFFISELFYCITSFTYYIWFCMSHFAKSFNIFQYHYKWRRQKEKKSHSFNGYKSYNGNDFISILIPQIIKNQQ